MVLYHLSITDNVLGAPYGGTIVMCSFVLLGSMGCAWMKMLVLSWGKYFGGQ